MRTSRYGAPIRKLVSNAIEAKKARYECPRCHKLKVTRKSNALWICRSCEATFAGGAYSFRTEAGEIATRLIGEYSRL
ncbi:MAG: 50S ribosomal protein L37ae [Candidatus Aenigmatarchaeota archaeon]